jgi:hypothetical protein
MTDRSVSWTDAKSVALLLSRVSGAVRQARVSVRPVAPAPVSPPVAPAPVSLPVVIPVAVPVKPLEPKVIPRLEQVSENPSDRLDTLVAWTLDHFRCTGAFVADDNGLTLAAHGISEAHVSLVGPLLSALAGVRTIPGIDATAGALLLGANMMSWVEAKTERGGFCLGAVGEQPLSTRDLEHLKDALEITVRGL